MISEKIVRLNELARKSRTPEGLTEAELVEQALLRKEYIADWRAGVESQLGNTYIVDAQGNKRKLEKKK
ncbi:MAG: DUF896 domain-containing protein [Oscillospiraceae bacterium]|nr:DUF896 domain-containing protein [Oscillospiraceae bacterium]